MTIRALLWLWLKCIRSWKSPLLYWIFRYTKYRNKKLPNKWHKVKDYNKTEFSRVLAEYDYLSDPAGGFFDYSPQEKNFYFLDRKTSRDCDNWARMWFWWCQERGYPVCEIKILETKNLRKTIFSEWRVPSHSLAVAKINNEYYLFDYRPAGGFYNLKMALKNNVVGYKKFVWAINKTG